MNVSSESEVKTEFELRILRLLGVYCVATMFPSLIFNGLLILIYLKNKHIRTPLNMSVVFLAILNVYSLIVERPLVIISNLKGKWAFGKTECHLAAFSMYFTGCASIYIMMVISFERFFIIYRPLEPATHKFVLPGLMLSLLFSLIWCAFPLLGWSYYSLEGAGTSCSVEWNERSFNVMSYNMAMFAFVLVIPLVVIVVTNVRLHFMIKDMSKLLLEASYQSQNVNLRAYFAKEKKLAKNIMIFITLFFLTWAPYSVVTLYVTISGHRVPGLVGTLPAMFAKSSQLWSSMFYLYTNTVFRRRCLSMFGCRTEPPRTAIAVQRDYQREHLDFQQTML